MCVCVSVCVCVWDRERRGGRWACGVRYFILELLCSSYQARSRHMPAPAPPSTYALLLTCLFIINNFLECACNSSAQQLNKLASRRIYLFCIPSKPISAFGDDGRQCYQAGNGDCRRLVIWKIMTCIGASIKQILLIPNEINGLKIKFLDRDQSSRSTVHENSKVLLFSGICGGIRISFYFVNKRCARFGFLT